MKKPNKRYTVHIDVLDHQDNHVIVGMDHECDSKLDCALLMIEARGKIEMSHLYDLMADGLVNSMEQFAVMNMKAQEESFKKAKKK
jgi:hypothetical protein